MLIEQKQYMFSTFLLSHSKTPKLSSDMNVLLLLVLPSLPPSYSSDRMNVGVLLRVMIIGFQLMNAEILE